MINTALHKEVVALDRDKHRTLRLDRAASGLEPMSALNSYFVAAAEFADACRDTPVVWVHAGNDPAGKPQVAPVAVFGVKPQQNLCIGDGRWRVRYVPAMLRLYPFALARMSADQVAVCIDRSWKGFSETEGDRLFDDAGQPTELLQTIQKQLEDMEMETERTRLLGELLLSKDLLRDMRFDADLPSGNKLTVDGFLAIDEKKLAELPDADVLDLQRKGVFGLLHAHQISMGNMRRLVEWHVERGGTA